MVSRRRFITMGGSMAAAGLMAAGPLGDDFLRVIAGEGSYSISKGRFETLVGELFVVRKVGNGEKGTVKLVEVKELTNPLDESVGIKRDGFSLLFENVEGNGLDQGNYRFDHRELHNMELLMVPVTSETGFHEVVFNNLTV